MVKQMPTNCLSVFDHFMGWRLKDLRIKSNIDLLLSNVTQRLK